MKLVIHTDGAARGNPGPSASGFSVDEKEKEGRMSVLETVYNGEQTNNYAEYNAVILALEWCSNNFDPKEVEADLYSDSELIVNQLKGNYKVKAKGLLHLNEKARQLMARFKSVALHNLPREAAGISRVDRALNHLLDRLEGEGKTARGK